MCLKWVYQCQNWPSPFNCPPNIRLDEDVLKTSFFFVLRRRLDQDEHIRLSHTSLEDVFKTSWSRPTYSSWPYVFKTFSRRFQDVFKTSCQDFFKTSSRRLPKTSSRHLQDVFKTFLKRLQDVLERYL